MSLVYQNWVLNEIRSDSVHAYHGARLAIIEHGILSIDEQANERKEKSKQKFNALVGKKVCNQQYVCIEKIYKFL